MHYNVIGHPDFAFPVEKVAIFCDSDFWHGFKPLPASNRRYWVAKISKNVSRDKLVNSTLEAEGWLVLRFRESRLLSSPSQCVEEILAGLWERA